jgi:thymidylate synthase
MNKLDKQYTDLLQDIIDNGIEKKDRTGTGTKSVFGRQIRHKMSDGFPLLTTKKMPFKTIVTELLWFLRGDTNIKFLVDNNCHIWDGDAYKRYQTETMFNSDNKWLNELDGINLGTGEKGKVYRQFIPEEFINKIKTDDEFAKKWGELGPIYGKQWRSWNGIDKEAFFNSDNLDERNRDARHGMFYKESEVDQIQNLINDLKTNPDSRRLMVNAWNVGELDQMVLPPCHYGFQVYTRELSIGERWNLLEKKVGKELFDSWVSEIVPFGGGLSEYLQSHNIPKRGISLMWNQRSVDTFLGLPFNIASYGLFLEIIAKEVNMVPDELIGNLGDVHLYSNHIEQSKEQIGRDFTEEEIIEHLQQSGMDALKKEPRMEYIAKLYKRTRQPFPLPTFDCPVIDEIPHTTFDELVFKLQPADFYMDDYVSHPTIKAPLSN